MNDSTVCPDARQLEQFLRGQASAGEAQRIHAHLAGCADCRRAVAAARGAEATTPGDAGGKRTSEAPTVAPEGGPQEFPFLAPPQGEGELGRLGVYIVRRLLGSGGMGVVFEAEDPKLQRSVALKVMRPGGARPDVFRERFLREARAAARLEHDHVVPVYQVDEDRGVLFLAMPLLRGETLEDRLQREAKPPLAEVLRIGREIAEGLDAAHMHGLIHRDVKPSNIWLEAGRGRVKILDFGLARVVDDEDKHLTQEGLVMGTPAFMAPEQAKGERVDARCDLFSLGCVLYRMTTGRNPFGGVNPFSLMLAVATQDPATPAALEPGLPASLNRLIMQLLAKNPAERFASAREVADGIAAIEQSRQATQAVPVFRPKRQGRRWVTAAILVILLGGLTGLGWRFAPQLAAMFTRPTPPQGSPAPNGNPTPNGGHPNSAAVDPITALALTGRPTAIAGVRSWTVETRGHRGPIHDAACNPTAPILATAGADGSVRLWELDSGKLFSILLAHDYPIQFVAWSPNGKILAALGAGGTVDLWEADSGRLLQTIHLGPCRALAWSPDGTRLATGGDKKIHLWEASTGKMLAALDGQVGETHALAWAPDGKSIAAVGADRTVRLWEIDKSKAARALPADAAAEAVAVAWSADAKLLAVGRADHTVQIWETAGPDKLLQTLPAAGPDKDHAGAPGLAWAPKGRTLAVIGPSGVQVWPAPYDKPTRSIKEAAGTAVSWSADGKRLVAADEEAGVRVWDVTPFNPPWFLSAVPVCKMERIRERRTSPDGTLAALEGEKTVWLFSTATGRLVHALHGPTREITGMAWSADCKRIAAVGGWDRRAYVWDSGTGDLVKTYTSPHPDCEITTLAWSPDDRTLALGVDRPVQAPLWDVNAGTTPVVLKGEHNAAINALLWIDAKTVITGSADNTAVAWNAETGRMNHVMRPGGSLRPRPVTALVLAPDGKLFAAGLGGGGEHAARLFHLDPERFAVGLRGPGVVNDGLAWLPDGKSLVGRGEDGVLRFWDAETGQATRTLPPPPGTEYFLPERGFGASSCGAFSIRYWDQDDMRPETTLVVAARNDAALWLAASGDGQYAAAKELESDVVYVVQTDAGMRTLDPAEFAAAYSWKNDPDRVGLPAPRP